MAGTEPSARRYFEYEVLRFPREIRPALKARLQEQTDFVGAWLQAVCAAFPERTLIDLVREGNPRLFPPCLCGKEASEYMPSHLGMRDNHVVFLRDTRAEANKSPSARLAELEAFRACRFQQGFASEGMLCNEPPIPLRVLDFLEIRDLLNVALVSKSAHQAAHLFFNREEAVAAAAFPPSEFVAKDRQANLLRDIRLASVVHGAPEAIPVGPTGLLFVRRSPANPASVRSVTWRYYWGTQGGLDNELYRLVQIAMRVSGEMFPDSDPYGPRFTTHFGCLRRGMFRVSLQRFQSCGQTAWRLGVKEVLWTCCGIWFQW